MADVEQILQKVHAFRAQKLDRLVSHCPADDKCRRVHLLQRKAGKVVPDFAANNKIDLLVMGTVHRTDVPALIMGNNAEMILNRVSCSVLAVKPNNFQTPIELSDSTIRQGASIGLPQRAVPAV